MIPLYTYRAWSPKYSSIDEFADTPALALAKLRTKLIGEDPQTFITALYILEFFIPGVPRSRQSASFTSRKLKSGQVKRWAYHKDQAEPWKAAAVKAARDAVENQPASPPSPVPGNYPAAVELYYAAPRPQRRNRPSLPGYPVGVRPDLGNLEKPLLDALRDAGLFADDCRVFRKLEEKRYADGKADVGVRVVVSWKTQYPEILPEKDNRSCKGTDARSSKSSKPSLAPNTRGRSTSGSRSTAIRSSAAPRRAKRSA